MEILRVIHFESIRGLKFKFEIGFYAFARVLFDMSVDYLLVLVVCQATFVQPDGITLPFTSLTYKSLPTNPKENLSSLENSGNASSPSKTDNVKQIEINSSKTSLESPIQPSLLKSIIPRNSNNALFKTNSLDVQSKPREQTDSPIKIRSSSPKIATAQASKLPPINISNISNDGSNNIKDNSISYSPKTRPFTTPVNYLETSKNNNVANLESSLNKGICDVPHSTYKPNQINIQPKYLDCNKQTNPEFERNSFNPVIQKLEKPKFVSDWENIQKDNLNKIKDNIDGSDALSNIQLLQRMNSQKHIKNKTSCKENIKAIEKPNAISNVLYPIDDIIFNSVSNLANANQVRNDLQSETTGEKMYANLNLAYNKNNVELIDTPSVKLRSDKVNAIPCNVEISDYETINSVAIAEPVSPNHDKIAIPLPCPNVAPALSPSGYKVSDTYNYVKYEMIPEIVTKSSVNVRNLNPNNCVMGKYLDIVSPNIIPIISTSSTPAHTLEVPAMSQLPGVYTPEITFSPPLTSHVVSNPTNVIYNDVPDIPCVNSLVNRFPTSTRPNIDHTLVRPNENMNSLIPFLSNIDYKPPCHPKSINQNYVNPSTYVLSPVYNNQPNLRSPENVNPVTLQPSSENIPCPSKIKVAKTNLNSSPFTESINNIISYFTKGLLSAFFDLNTKSDESVSLTECPIIANIETDAPSYIYSETSISVAMPLFMLNPPQLPSPTFLPTPNVLPLKECDNKSSLKRTPVVKKPKAYISSITINLIPSNDVNDIIVFV